jgi:hypothetical protein
VLPFKKKDMAIKKESPKPARPKKEFKKEIAVKLEAALAELKDKLGEKEFQHRLKKAAKMLVHNLHGKDFSENGHNGKTDKPAAEKEIKIVIKKISSKKKAVTAK